MPKIYKANRADTDTALNAAARDTDSGSTRLASDATDAPAVAEAQQTQELAGAMPFAASKSKESGFDNALRPQHDTTVEQESRLPSNSTLSEGVAVNSVSAPQHLSQAQAAHHEDSPPSVRSAKAGKDETAKEDGVHRVAIDREHAVVTSVNPIPATDQLPDLSASQARREGRIRLAAYALSERRGFLPGFEIQDWLEAERQIDMEADLHAATEKAA